MFSHVVETVSIRLNSEVFAYVPSAEGERITGSEDHGRGNFIRIPDGRASDSQYARRAQSGTRTPIDHNFNS